MSKVKEGAEKAKSEMESAKKEIEKRAGAYDNMAANGRKEENSRPASLHLEINLTLEIGQVMLSLLHAWGLDKDLDKVAISKLGLLRPQVNIILRFTKLRVSNFFKVLKTVGKLF